MNDTRYEAVFISDLHLNPEEPHIIERFSHFTQWASDSTRKLFILGDFFHVWVGDDGLEQWSADIAAQLNSLAQKNVTIYYIHGNRDFLLGSEFAKRAALTLLPDPSVIKLDQSPILITHGDQYCIRDKGHQWLRRLTRNWWFPRLFLRLPLSLRTSFVSRIRMHSQMSRGKPAEWMDVVPEVMVSQLKQNQVNTVIHGHIHKPGLVEHLDQYQQYVLSDWDTTPQILCYNKSMGFCYVPFVGDEDYASTIRC